MRNRHDNQNFAAKHQYYLLGDSGDLIIREFTFGIGACEVMRPPKPALKT
ncbi:hypothetical protein [Paenibacillus sp. 1011MAR3C5]|nr:hypothetical protein [Paenibacillus sp. 1011MAR3C5]